MISEEIENLAEKIIETSNNVTFPVNIKKICEKYDIMLKLVDLDDNISGFCLKREDGIGIIGVNKTHNNNRQRSSIAHELGHYFLHSDSNNIIYIDKIETKLFYCNEDSSKEELKKEREANSFASALLVPISFLQEAIKDYKDASDDNIKQIITDLARKFKISTDAMKYRLINLGIITSY